MITSDPVQSNSVPSYTSVLAQASSGTENVSRDQKVDPPPRIPSRPNLSRQPGDPPDDTVYLPAQKDETGPTYSNLNPALPRKAS